MNLNPIESTLVHYHELCQKAEIQKIERSHQPILFLKTVNGQREISVAEDRSQLPFIQRVLAYFGFGSASLGSVTTFLQTQFLQSRKFSELKSIDNKIFECFQAINRKIQIRNASHWIQKINCILPTVTVKIFECAASTTYHPKNLTSEQDQEGVLDFAHVFPEIGTAYIGDGTSHGKPESRKKLEPLWREFNQTFIAAYENSKLFDSQTQVEVFLRKCTLDLSTNFETKGIASTFSLSMLIEINGKKHVASIHAGDSTLLHVTKDGAVYRIIPVDSPANQSELSSLNDSRIYFNMREVQSGDRIVGMTDGITDFIPEAKLDTLLKHDKTIQGNLLAKLEQAIKDLAADDQEYPGITKLDPTVKSKSDDISAFMMVVP